MIKEQILALATLISTISTALVPPAAAFLSPIPENYPVVLAERELDLTTRLPNEYGNQVFSDNILLALHYLKGDVELPVDREKLREPFEVTFTLKPGEVFAYHGNVLPEFTNPAVTMNSRFFIEEGYKSLAGLGGNGVCHLATLLNWTASEAGLLAVATVNHNFAPIPGVPREFGTSIRSQSPNQNLYIKNNFDYPVEFVFKASKESILLQVKS